MTKHTEKVLLTKLTVLSTPENGFKTSSMAMESKVGQMAPNMKVTMRSGSSTVLVNDERVSVSKCTRLNFNRI
jgi:hypothetical protein